jgi:hypothetical protein
MELTYIYYYMTRKQEVSVIAKAIVVTVAISCDM